MNKFPLHEVPVYSSDAGEDALFHYTTANGLIGILSTGELWNTAYFCANDESELAAGNGILRQIFGKETQKMINDDHPLVEIFSNRGVNIWYYSDGFEKVITSLALGSLCTYMTCFCMPSGPEDFIHGLLSQWRGYGSDGGYALQFSRKKLLAEVDRANSEIGLNYQLQGVHYHSDNKLKEEVLSHKDAFINAYRNHLDVLHTGLNEEPIKSPIADLTRGPLESLLDYLIHTKNIHFKEERECRLSLVEVISPEAAKLPVSHFNRNGLIVPFTKTPKDHFNILNCLEWIVVGPSARINSRFRSVGHLVKRLGLPISVRPSHIPYTRS